jgi:hypothetical protein
MTTVSTWGLLWALFDTHCEVANARHERPRSLCQDPMGWEALRGC